MSSYGILHIQKFKSHDVAGLEIHISRSKPSKSNPDIDYSKTESNWWPKPCPYLHNAVKKRLEKRRTTKKLRDDAVVLTGVLVSASPDFFKNATDEIKRQYFNDALSFLEDKYRSENIISAVVHMDESTPHMHVSIVPMTEDMRICAKDIFDKNELQALQTEFHLEVSSRYGLKRGGDGEKRRHLSENEYKLQKRKEALEKEESIIKDKEEKLKDRINDYNSRYNDINNKTILLEEQRRQNVIKFKELLKDDPESFKSHFKEVMQRYEKLQKDYTNLRQIAENLKIENEDLLRENGLLKEDYEEMHSLFDDDLTDEQFESLKKLATKYRALNKIRKENQDQNWIRPGSGY